MAAAEAGGGGAAVAGGGGGGGWSSRAAAAAPKPPPGEPAGEEPALAAAGAGRTTPEPGAPAAGGGGGGCCCGGGGGGGCPDIPAATQPAAPPLVPASSCASRGRCRCGRRHQAPRVRPPRKQAAGRAARRSAAVEETGRGLSGRRARGSVGQALAGTRPGAMRWDDEGRGRAEGRAALGGAVKRRACEGCERPRLPLLSRLFPGGRAGGARRCARAAPGEEAGRGARGGPGARADGLLRGLGLSGAGAGLRWLRDPSYADRRPGTSCRAVPFSLREAASRPGESNRALLRRQEPSRAQGS